MTSTAPGWQTEDLVEEWPENSPSPPSLPLDLPSTSEQPQIIPRKVDAASLHVKRGSLRMLGCASARALPPSRSESGLSGSERLVSGHVDGGKGHVVSGGSFVVPPSIGLPSPPSSRSSSEASAKNHDKQDEAGANGGVMRPVEEAVGTFIVKEGVEDVGRTPRNPFTPKGGVAKDIFGALALERMFEPPSPPTDGPSKSPENLLPSTSSPVDQAPPRRLSHAYAPINPSRLSKSVTPPSHTSIATSTTNSASDSRASTPIQQRSGLVMENADDATVPYPEEGETTEILDSRYSPDHSRGSDTHRLPEKETPAGETSSLAIERDHTSLALDARKSRDYPFTFTSPVGLSLKNSPKAQSPFSPPEPHSNGEPSHSTVHLRQSQTRVPSLSRPVPMSKRTPANIAKRAVRPQALSSALSHNPNLRLFRNTYDTYTRDHLSAIVDSIAIEPSPSPPTSIPNGRQLRDWSPAAESEDRSTPSGSSRSRSSGTFSGASTADARSSKRLRLSPPSPKRREGALRDWGAQGRMVMDRIRVGVADESATSGSRASEHGAEGAHRDDDPTMDYVSLPPTPPQRTTNLPIVHRKTHHSNPSTTSSTYLATAKELMARIKSRQVSESASGMDSSPAAGGDQRVLSETDDQSIGTRNAILPAVGVSDKGKGKAKTIGESPRRTLRRLSAAEEIKKIRDASDEDLATSGRDASEEISTLKGNIATTDAGLGRLGVPGLAVRPPSRSSVSSSQAPLPPPQSFNPDDLNRYVSSSTYQTATTISTSFVKHRGPRSGPSAVGGGMRMIKPDDVQGVVPDRIGRMRFDRTTMKWVKNGGSGQGLGDVQEAGESRQGGSEESVDVFAGLDSFGASPEILNGSQPPETTAPDQAASGNNSHRDSDHPNDESVRMPENMLAARPKPTKTASAPAILPPSTPAPSGPTPPLKPFRSALRNPNSGPSLTPAGLQKRAGWHEPLTPAQIASTPGETIGKRSVSFSDGKKSGKIVHTSGAVDLLRSGRLTAGDHDNDLFQPHAGDSSRSFLPSTRTRRIQGILEDMEELSLDEGTPSKPSKNDQSIRHSHPNLSEESDSTEDDYHPAPFKSFRRGGSRGGGNVGDATFLTECSFGVAHDRLVQLITDVQTFVPYWEELKSINLKGKGAESVARLKEFLPVLDEVNLDDNFISYLSGIPSTVRTLHVAGNRLSALTSVAHLGNLQYLDISRNQLDSVSQLQCLKHLRELKADKNDITDLSGIMGMDCLVKLSVSGNKIDKLDFASAKWEKLEVLNLSSNRISRVRDLHRLTGLATLNLDDNRLDALEPLESMPHLRILRLSNNDLPTLDLSRFPKIRTLFADSNKLAFLTRSSGSSNGPSLEHLSLRNQRLPSDTRLLLSTKDLSSSLKRLYISGNPIVLPFFPKRESPMYALTYLEMAACNLSRWPGNMATVLPNLKVLNVNYNFLEDLEGVAGMRSLRKLMVVGNRLGGSFVNGGKGVVRSLKGMTGLVEIDLRMNPSTLSFYLPLLLPSKYILGQSESISTKQADTDGDVTITPSNLAPDEWATLDSQFRRSLPDEWYSRRLAYRGLVMAACGKLTILDGVEILDGEKRKAMDLLAKARGV